jgi:hypothetical protein
VEGSEKDPEDTNITPIQPEPARPPPICEYLSETS